MELGLYITLIVLTFFVLSICAVAERWIGICSSCQINVPDLRGNRPTRLEAVSVKRPYRIIQPKTSQIEGVSGSSARSSSLTPEPHQPQLASLKTDCGSVAKENNSVIYQDLGESEPEEFLCKVDTHNQIAIYTVENDKTPELPKRNHQSNYCSFVTF